MRICYTPRKFKPDSLSVIDEATGICEEYSERGFSLTLRQLYYQFVSRGLLDGGRWYVDPVTGTNNQRNYDRLGEIISNARLAGLFDWDFIVDRTRNLEKKPTWASPEALIDSAAKQYLADLWAPQKKRIEVWIEKDAAIGVIETVCNLNNVPYFSCRGYTSSSEMWSAANRIGEYIRNGEQTLILHIGDHDPSGLDMTRDIEDRLRLFIAKDWANQYMGAGTWSRGDIRRSMIERMRSDGSSIGDHEQPWQVKRIALTLDQIEAYNPPPNYAKQTDARWQKYFDETGLTESWELDALDPEVMEELIVDEIEAFRDDEALGRAEAEQERDRAVLLAVKENWETIKAVHGGAA